jgi:hypothetical protein
VSASFRLLRGFLGDAALERALVAIASAPTASWQRGRQGTGYEKLALEGSDFAPEVLELTRRSLAELGAGAELAWDRWLLRYVRGTHVPPHTDPPLASGQEHWRLNGIVRAAGRGGVLALDGRTIELALGDAVVFRPDACRHEVSLVEEGERLVWSVGCNRPQQPASGSEREGRG